MTINLKLMIGVMSSQPGALELAQVIAANIAKVYWAASGHDINLMPKNAGYIGPGGVVTNDLLHSRLEKLTGDQRNRKQVDTIGLLIADTYAHGTDYFGVMFDQAFSPASTSPGARTPREGCAVFLNGIGDMRAQEERFEEAIFTAIHELGHVFNLEHSEANSYMFESATGSLQKLNQSAFHEFECKQLSRCSSDPYTWPGGSAFLDHGYQNAPHNVAPTDQPRCVLNVRASKDAFHRFEPVELDVALKARGKSAVTVPDSLDAGYACFAVWIEEPDGARRKLRSPNHYCTPRGELVLDERQRFQRDISIFGESGGYTFRRAGQHRVWAVFEYAPGESVMSNVIEVEVLPENENSSFWRDGEAILAEPCAALTLYHRSLTRQRMRAVERLDAFSETHRRDPTTAMTRYAIGRALGQAALTRRRSAGAGLVKQARQNLTLAARRPSLGDHRRQIAEQMLENLSYRYRQR